MAGSSVRPASERLGYPFREFCEQVGIGITTGYGEVRNGRLKVRKVGRRTIVAAQDGAAWLAALPTATDPEPAPAKRGREGKATRPSFAAHTQPITEPASNSAVQANEIRLACCAERAS